MKKEIRVLLADDSLTIRKALLGFLSPDPRLEVIGAARDGEEVVAMARLLKPDVVSMDVHMPKLDGLQATRRIMETCPCAIVVVSSQSAGAETDLSFSAMGAGAVEIFAKPTAEESTDLPTWGRKLADLIVRVGEMPLRLSHPAFPAGFPAQEGEESTVEIFALAASTGGPPVLAEILKAIPAGLPIPLLIAQHITEGFTGGFQKWLSQACPLPVEIAGQGERPLAGRVYLAPDGCHLEMVGPVFRTPRSTGGFCPSGDRLFKSLAKSYGAQAGGAVLTGMGEDGGRGLLELSKAGGFTLAQEESSCVVYGMPRFARELGAAQKVLLPEDIARAITRLRRSKQNSKL